jgi:hypothetical protein
MPQAANDVNLVNRMSSLNLIITDYGALPILSENQLWEGIHKWTSLSDPSTNHTNHNIACDTQHKKAFWDPYMRDEVARLLLEHDENLSAKDNKG